MFKGTFVALVTPFTKAGSVDEAKLKELVEWHISEGIDGLVPVGTTGESATLSHEEHARVIEVVVKAARKRVRVLAGAGSNSTQEAVSLSKEAQDLWADGILTVSPYYNKPTQEGLYAHFSAVAKSVKIPIMLYNIPSRTSVNLKPEVIQSLAKAHKNIVGVKEATGSMDQTSEIIERCGNKFSVMSGDDSLTLPLMSLGATGVISVVANLIPKMVINLCKAASAGKAKEARDLHHKLFPLVKACFAETNPSPIKAAMEDVGLIDNDKVRLPLTKIRPETRTRLKAVLKNFRIKVK